MIDFEFALQKEQIIKNYALETLETD